MSLPNLRVVIAVGACVLSSPILVLAEPGNEPATNAATSSARDAGAPARAGQWIHVDPQTGKRVPPPPGAAAAIAADPALSTSHDGLVEQPAPGGGMMLNLQGRFRSAVTATVGADGKVVRDCVPPGTAARKE